MPELVDTARWPHPQLKSLRIGKRETGNPDYFFDGVQYVTEGECLLAKTLKAMGVPFTPNVQFYLYPVRPPPAGEPRGFTPDFVFNQRAYVWTNPDGTQEVIHGIEAKGRSISTKHQRKADQLFRAYGIRIRLLTTPEIRVYWTIGMLPILPLDALT